MTLAAILLVCFSNALWAALCFLLVVKGEKERDKLTQKILAKGLSEYAYTQERLSAKKPEQQEEKKEDEQKIVPLSEVERDPFLLQKFSEAVTKNLNNL